MYMNWTLHSERKQRVFHLSFCDKFIIRFEATNVVQRIS